MTSNRSKKTVTWLDDFIYDVLRGVGDFILYNITPLADNIHRDTYQYEIIVRTGMRKNAGTYSKVSSQYLIICMTSVRPTAQRRTSVPMRIIA
jgi:hypothetical protein